MADGALHPAGGGAVALGDLRVQALGHRVDILRLVHREQDGVPQKLVTLDVGRHTDLVQNLGHGEFVAVHAGVEHPFFLSQSHLEHAGCQHVFVKWLDKIVGKPFVQQFLHHFFALECTGDKKGRVPLPGGIVALLDRQCIQPRHKGVQQHHLRPDGQHLLQDLVPVLFHDRDLHAFLLQCFAAGRRDLCPGIRHQKSHFVHGCFLQCVQFP